jgi:hypothetical protein
MAGKIGIDARAAACSRVVSGESDLVVEKSAVKYFTRVSKHPRKPLAWRPFLKALADVVVSDIEFLATGERVGSAERGDNKGGKGEQLNFGSGAL